MQLQIDSGVKYCDPCDRFGANTFCGACGQRFFGRDLIWRTCTECKSIVSTDFCSHCGHEVASQVIKDIESGKIDISEGNENTLNILNQIKERMNMSNSTSDLSSIVDDINKGMQNG